MRCYFIVTDCFRKRIIVLHCISHVIITLIPYFLIPKSRDLVSHNPRVSGLKNRPGSGIAIHRYTVPKLRETEM